MNADLHAHITARHRLWPLPDSTERLQSYAERVAEQGAVLGAQWALERAVTDLRDRADAQTALAHNYRAQPSPTYGDTARADAAERRAQMLMLAIEDLETLRVSVGSTATAADPDRTKDTSR